MFDPAAISVQSGMASFRNVPVPPFRFTSQTVGSLRWLQWECSGLSRRFCLLGPTLRLCNSQCTHCGRVGHERVPAVLVFLMAGPAGNLLLEPFIADLVGKL